jgi:hypothetical protein
LPNDGVLPTASIFTESSEEIFPAEWYFVTKLGPQVSPFPVPIFGVSKYYSLLGAVPALFLLSTISVSSALSLLSLPESQALPRARFFVENQIENSRQRRLCREPNKNSRQRNNIRQRGFFAESN